MANRHEYAGLPSKKSGYDTNLYAILGPLNQYLRPKCFVGHLYVRLSPLTKPTGEQHGLTRDFGASPSKDGPHRGRRLTLISRSLSPPATDVELNLRMCIEEIYFVTL